MYVPTVSSPPSAEVQELGQRLYETANQYRMEHPGMGSVDVSEGFKIGWHLFRSGSGMTDSNQRTWVALALGLTIAGLVAALFVTGGFLGMIPHPVIIVLMVLGLAGAAAAAKSSKVAGPDSGSPRIAVAVGLVLLALAGVFFFLYFSGAIPLD